MEKYIIEKDLDRWYTSTDLEESSESFLDAHLFTLPEVIIIFNSHKAGFLRVERITPDCDTVVESIFGAVEESGAWKEGETWGDFYNGWRGFIRDECKDILAWALAQSCTMSDIEELCLDEVIKRRSMQ
jgi:hypothetical protein